jgi:hypothetical protein
MPPIRQATTSASPSLLRDNRPLPYVSHRVTNNYHIEPFGPPHLG